MGLLGAIVGIFLMVSIVGFVIFSESISHYRQYRRAFENQLNRGLRESFIRFSIPQLFLLTVTTAISLLVIGWLVMGFSGALGGLVLGMLLPFMAVKRIRRKRQLRFVQQLPDGLHALSASLRSGANIARGLEQLAQWQPAPFSQEMGLVIAEYEFGKSLEDALEGLYRRIPVQEVELVNTAIVLSKNVGGNVSDTLETLALTLTEKLAVEGKVQSLTSTGRLQGWVAMAIPMVVGAFILSVQPDKIDFFFNDIRGYVTLTIIGVMMVAAFVSIRRIVNIDI